MRALSILSIISPWMKKQEFLELIQLFSSISNKPFVRSLYPVISESSCNFHYLSLSAFVNAQKERKFSDVSFLIETTICPGYAGP